MKINKYHFFFGNLANPLRVEIISILKSREMSVSEIAKSIKVEQSKLSHALANLRECNIVKTRREGKQIIYSLNKNTILPILELIDKHSENYCGGSCARCTIKH